MRKFPELFSPGSYSPVSQNGSFFRDGIDFLFLKRENETSQEKIVPVRFFRQKTSLKKSEHYEQN